MVCQENGLKRKVWASRQQHAESQSLAVCSRHSCHAEQFAAELHQGRSTMPEQNCTEQTLYWNLSTHLLVTLVFYTHWIPTKSLKVVCRVLKDFARVPEIALIIFDPQRARSFAQNCWPGTWFFVKKCVSRCCSRSGCTTFASAKYSIKDYQGIFICCPQDSSKLPSKLIFSRMQSTKGRCSYLSSEASFFSCSLRFFFNRAALCLVNTSSQGTRLTWLQRPVSTSTCITRSGSSIAA